MATLIGPPMQPPLLPLMTEDIEQNVEILMNYIQDLISYLSEYRPTVESP